MARDGGTNDNGDTNTVMVVMTMIMTVIMMMVILMIIIVEVHFHDMYITLNCQRINFE